MTIEATLLEGGERLIWCDRPHPLRYAWQKGRLHAAFGVVWTAMTVMAFQNAIGGRDPMTALQNALGSHDLVNELMKIAMPAAFVVIGIVMLLQPLWHFYRALHATYMLTDQRAIVDISGVWPNRLSLPLSRLPFTQVRLGSAGFGDVVFKETAVQSGEGASLKREGFIAIAKVQEVDRLLRRALGRAQ